jgi:translocation and assembly module TamB
MSDVRVTEDAIDLPEISGRFAEGTVRGRARYNLANPARSFYTLTVDGGDADAVFESFGLGGKNSPFGGRFGLNMRGNLGRELRGSGTLTFQRARVTGFDLSDLRVPFDWTYDPLLGGRIAMRDFGGQFSGGRLNGEVNAAFGDTVTVEGRLRFVDLSFRALLGKFGSSSGLGSGRMNGTFNFTGRNVRSLNDVSGLLVAQLGEGPVLDAPVFNRIAEYIVPSPGSQGGLVQFNGGDLRARLVGGQFRVERLALSGPKAQLFIEGVVGLTGRLDLDVVAVTNQLGLDPRVLRAFGLRLPLAGPVPIGLILEVASFLSNRTVRLKVTGTVDQPIVQVNVGQILTEEAIRFFLNPYLPEPFQRGIP